MVTERNKEYENLIINTVDDADHPSDLQTPRKKQTARQKLYMSYYLFKHTTTTRNNDTYNKYFKYTTGTKTKKIFLFLAAMMIFHFIALRFQIVNRRGSNSYYIHFKNEDERCSFHKDGPKPVVLMALGRSGSSVTWNTLSLLTGDKTVAYEITGGNQNKSIDFFNSIPDHIGERWASLRLCNIQQRHMSKSKEDGNRYSIVGFQWKPYFASFDHPYALSGLQRLADDRIKVIYLTRNPLDR
jgi:hypothetical protein